MRRGRLFLVFGLLMLVATLGLFVLIQGGSLLGQLGQAGPTAAPVTNVPQETSLIVIATQDVTRGATITADAVALAPWPTSALPLTAMFAVEEVIGLKARTDIPRGQPILSTMVTTSLQNLADVGSDAALSIPPGQVAITVPISRLSSVGFAVQDGDHVDVIASMLVIDLDPQFQTVLPNFSSTASEPFAAGGPGVPGVRSAVALPQAGEPEPYIGQFDSSNSEGLPFYAVPSESQRPRLVVQRVVQDALVLHMGTFSSQPVAEPTAVPTEGPPGQPTVTPAPGAAPTAEPRPDIVTLVVSPQDALVLNYLVQSGANLTLVLRSAGDTSQATTDSVTLQYLIDRFGINVASKQPYGQQPRLDALVPPCLENDPYGQLCRQPDGTITVRVPVV